MIHTLNFFIFLVGYPIILGTPLLKKVNFFGSVYMHCTHQFLKSGLFNNNSPSYILTAERIYYNRTKLLLENRNPL